MILLLECIIFLLLECIMNDFTVGMLCEGFVLEYMVYDFSMGICCK